jgi:adenine-specific DNA-methyltransferase
MSNTNDNTNGNDTNKKSKRKKIQIEANKIYNKDCNEYLELLKPETIDCIVLDPPYYGVVNEKWDNQWKSQDEYNDWMDNIISKLKRVAKNNCNLWLFGYPYQLSFLIQIVEKHGFKYKQHIVIDKGLQSVAGRTSNKLKMFPTATEYLIFFYKDARNFIKTFLQNKQKEKDITSKDINMRLGKAINGGGTWSTIAGKKQKNIQYPTLEDWGKLQKIFGKFDINYDDYIYCFNIEKGITDVWNDIKFYDKTYKKYHPTQKPYKLIERIINCSTKDKYNVLDIFMGSGMTALVCKDKGRNYYGCELEKKYFEKNLILENK